MSNRTLKLLLAVSVAVNLFAVAAGAAVLITHARVERQVEDQRRPGRNAPALAVIADMDPEVRDHVRQSLRAAALEARPDFDAARKARREAVAMAAAPEMDRAAVQARLEQSRLAEMRGRARLESVAVEVLAGLGPEDRAALAPVLARHGPRQGGQRRARHPPSP